MGGLGCEIRPRRGGLGFGTARELNRIGKKNKREREREGFERRVLLYEKTGFGICVYVVVNFVRGFDLKRERECEFLYVRRMRRRERKRGICVVCVERFEGNSERVDTCHLLFISVWERNTWLMHGPIGDLHVSVCWLT